MPGEQLAPVGTECHRRSHARVSDRFAGRTSVETPESRLSLLGRVQPQAALGDEALAVGMKRGGIYRVVVWNRWSDGVAGSGVEELRSTRLSQGLRRADRVSNQ